MMCQKSIEKAVKMACMNPYWKEYYENAPSKMSKRYVELGFYYSVHLGEIPDYDAYKKERQALESKFSKVDWQYLLRYAGHTPRKAFYKKMESEM